MSGPIKRAKAQSYNFAIKLAFFDAFCYNRGTVLILVIKKEFYEFKRGRASCPALKI